MDLRVPVVILLAATIIAAAAPPVMAGDCGCGLPGPDDSVGPGSGPEPGGGSPGGGGEPSPESPTDSGTSSWGSEGQYTASSGTAAEISLQEAKGLFQQGRYSESLSAYNRTIAADPASYAGWMGKGTTETVLGMYGSALASFARAARIKPGDPDPWVSRGEVLLAAGDPAAAIAAFDRALAIQPGYAPALEGKSRAEGMQNPIPASPVPSQIEPTVSPSMMPPSGNATPDGEETPVHESPLSLVPMAIAFLVFVLAAARHRRK